MGQGYSDVMNPSVATLMRNFGGAGGNEGAIRFPNIQHPSPPPSSPPSSPPPSSSPPPPQHPPLETDNVPEEKVCHFLLFFNACTLRFNIRKT